MNILVRNLPREVSEQELRDLFKPFGRVRALNIVADQLSGVSKGFGFVDMADETEGKAAIKALDGKLINGVKIRVKTTRLKYHPAGRTPIQEPTPKAGVKQFAKPAGKRGGRGGPGGGSGRDGKR